VIDAVWTVSSRLYYCLGVSVDDYERCLFYFGAWRFTQLAPLSSLLNCNTVLYLIYGPRASIYQSVVLRLYEFLSIARAHITVE
jgi:hypothetical protein